MELTLLFNFLPTEAKQRLKQPTVKDDKTKPLLDEVSNTAKNEEKDQANAPAKGSKLTNLLTSLGKVFTSNPELEIVTCSACGSTLDIKKSQLRHDQISTIRCRG